MKAPRAKKPESSLTAAFDAFIASAQRMEASYGQMQAEIAQLRRELEERNAELASSLDENRAIRESLQRILDALPCGVIVTNSRHEIVLMNPEACGQAGITAAGARSLENLPAQTREVLESALNREDEHEFRLERSEGPAWLSIRRSTLPRTTAGDERAILILRDVTTHKQAEQQREVSRNLVALGEVSAVLAHEVRNPLSSMELWTGLLAKQPGMPEEARYSIEHLQAGVRSLSATVNNVLQFHSRACPNPVRLKVLPVLQAGVNFISPLADQAGIKLSLRAELDGAEIEGDPNGLQQVILNLAINAFRYTPMGGTFAIAARRKPEGKVAVDFVDGGCGIPEAQLPHVFEAGFSGDGQSPGLGLAICKQIVEQHQGTIRVTSGSGKGSTFSLELPAL